VAPGSAWAWPRHHTLFGPGRDRQRYSADVSWPPRQASGPARPCPPARRRQGIVLLQGLSRCCSSSSSACAGPPGPPGPPPPPAGPRHPHLADHQVPAAVCVVHCGVDPEAEEVLVIGGRHARGHQHALLRLALAGVLHAGAEDAGQLHLQLHAAVLVQVPVHGVLVVGKGGDLHSQGARGEGGEGGERGAVGLAWAAAPRRASAKKSTP
jgi:hypothetical protein